MAAHISPKLCNSSKSYNIVIVGGSYAGLSASLTLMALKDGQAIPFATYGNYSHLRAAPRVQNLRITIIDQRDGFFHTVGTPLAHVSPTHATSMWKQYGGFPKLNRPDVTFIHGTVTGINCGSQTLLYNDTHNKPQSQQYDYILVSTGVRRKWPVVPRADSFLPHIKDASSYSQQILAAEKLGVVVIGGGAVGVEFAGKVKAHYPKTPVTLVHSRDQLLSNEPLPEEFKVLSLKILQEEGVQVILGKRAAVNELPDQTFYIKFQDGGRLHAGLVIMAASHASSSATFLPREILSNDGSIMVDLQLRLKGDPSQSGRMFAAGDITDLQGIKLGGSAMVMGSVAAANIYSSLLHKEYKSQPLLLEDCPQIQPKMALSIGTSAVCYAGGDAKVQYGKELVDPFFGSDMGWQRVLNALGLGDHFHRQR